MGSILRAKDVLDDLHFEIQRLQTSCKSHVIHLACIKVGDNPETDSYLESIQRILTKKYNIAVDVVELCSNVSEKELLNVIERLNNNRRTSAILLLRPFPKHLNLEKAQKEINGFKDVDGVSPSNIVGFWSGDENAFGSCTAEAALYMLHAMVDDIRGMDVVVVGRSREVGRPIAELLLREDATVTICHSATDDLAEHLKNADAVISCVGKPHLIDGSMLKKGSYVVDVGMSMENGILVGDVDIDTALERASYVTPAIGGVGAITTHMLALHTVQADIMQE